MKFIINVLSILLFWQVCYADTVKTNKDKFNFIDNGIQRYYSYQISSDVSADISIDKHGHVGYSLIGFPYSKNKDLNEVAQIFYEIVNYYHLEKVIKLNKCFSISFGSSIFQEHILAYINNDNDWPVNIYNTLRKKYKKNEVDMACRVLVRQEINKSNIYKPFYDVFNKIGCSIQLHEVSFADRVLCGKDAYSKNSLIKFGMFKKNEANKEIYPMVVGPITFNISCTSSN